MFSGKRETKVNVSNAGEEKNCLKVIIYHNWGINTAGLTECCNVFLRYLLVVQLVKKSVASTERRDNYCSDNKRTLGRCDSSHCTTLSLISE